MEGWEKEMDMEWIKAVLLLCMEAENNADSMSKILRYLEIMEDGYGLDAEAFHQLYENWYRTGEIQEKYRKKTRSEHLPLYHLGADGMCRMLNEGVIDEEMFFEIFWETPYKILKENDIYTGYYPSLPGCIGFADNKENLEKEMQRALRKWIRSAFYLWRELTILEE